MMSTTLSSSLTYININKASITANKTTLPKTLRIAIPRTYYNAAFAPNEQGGEEANTRNFPDPQSGLEKPRMKNDVYSSCIST